MSATAVEMVSPLQTGFAFWYMRRGKGSTLQPPPPSVEAESASADPSSSTAAVAVHPYEIAVKWIATVQSVEDFWSVYDHMVRPNQVSHNSTTTFHFFREGVKPTWEDPMNSRGGQWIVRLRKGLASRYWEELLLALIGSQFTTVPDGEVCGVVISIRYTEDVLSVWNKTASDPEIIDRIRETIKRILQLPNFAHMEYKHHETSLQGDKMNASSSSNMNFAAPGAGTSATAHTTYRASAHSTHHHAHANKSSSGTSQNPTAAAGGGGGGAAAAAAADREDARQPSTFARPSAKRDVERPWR